MNLDHDNNMFNLLLNRLKHVVTDLTVLNDKFYIDGTIYNDEII